MHVEAVVQIALVLGAGGQIGAHLVSELLSNSWEVHGIDSGLFAPSPLLHRLASHSRLALHSLDVRNADLLLDLSERVGAPTLVVNLTGPARPSFYLQSPALTAEVHFLGTQAALEVCRRSRCAYIHASSSEVYGNCSAGTTAEVDFAPMTPLSLRASYVEAKRVAEALTFAHHHQSGLPVALLRLFNVYGPDASPDDDRVIPALIRAAREGVPFHVHGDGEQIRCFTYVDDVIRAFLACTDSLDRGLVCLNVGNPEQTTINSLVQLAGTIAGRPLAVLKAKPRPNDIRRRVPNIHAAELLLGWSPQVPLRHGLQSLLRRST